MRIRQIALVARELAPVVDELTSALGIEVSFNDPSVKRWGLENAVFPIGDTFLEVVAPTEEGTTAGRLLDRRSGDGGYMVILQVDDIAAARARVERLGVRIVERGDRDGAWFTHLHPKDVGGAILSLDAMDPPERWDWAGPHWRDHVRTGVVTGITGVDVQANDPQAMAARWAGTIGRAAGTGAAGPEIELDDGGRIRFVPVTDGRGEGVGGVDVAARDLAALRARIGRGWNGDTVELCGTRFRFVQDGG